MPYKYPEDQRAYDKRRSITPKCKASKLAWQRRNAHRYKNFTLRLDRDEMYEPLKRMAEKRGISLSALITLYCTWQLEQDDT